MTEPHMGLLFDSRQGSAASFLCRYFGYKQNYLWQITGVLCAFTIFFWFISVVCLKFLNFQRR